MADGDGSARRKGVALMKPIMYGNVARYFGKKREEDGHTHSWTCFLRPFRNEDMSLYVRKVQFKLHESYTNPTRILTKPPYEINETGWGEFEIVIKVFFSDSSEKPLTIYHLLKLFDHQNNPLIVSGKKNLVSEQYDEIVFTDPSNTMYHVLSNPKILGPPLKHDPDVDYKELEEKTQVAISSAHKKIKLEIHDLNERLKNSKEAIQKLKEQIEKAEDEANG